MAELAELAQLELDAERERRELVAKYEMKENELNEMFLELEALRVENKRDVASEKEKNEELRKELAVAKEQLAVAKEPTVFEIFQAFIDVSATKEEDVEVLTAPLLALYERIMSISDEQLRREIRFSDGDGNTVLHIAALAEFPHAVLSRLVQCGSDINTTDKEKITYMIINAVKGDSPAVFDSLALLGADLSMRDADGNNILQLSEYSLDLFYLCQRHHGLKKGQAIAAGFVSPLKGKSSSMPELHNKSIMKMTSSPQKCIRIMSLEMNQLRVEARECDEDGYCPIMFAADCGRNFPLRVLQRLQVAYPAGVNAQDTVGRTALINAVGARNVEYVELYLEMGSCAGLHFDAGGANAFEMTDEGNAQEGQEDEDKRQAIIAIFKKHGITSTLIPKTYTSPLYYESIYFTQRVADANWAQHGMTLMCMQEVDVEYRKFGEKALRHLSNEASCFFKVFACVDGCDRLGNGIARLMLAFLGGENMRAKLTGVPLDPKF
jgi:ankyrin repeat protein